MVVATVNEMIQEKALCTVLGHGTPPTVTNFLSAYSSEDGSKSLSCAHVTRTPLQAHMSLITRKHITQHL